MMKWFWILTLICGMLLSAVSCGKEPVSPADTDGGTQESSDTKPEMTTSPDCEGYGVLNVFVRRSDGEEIAPYRELLYERYERTSEDGRLMNKPASEVLPEIADEIPSVTLDAGTKASVSRIGAKASGGDRFYVFDGADFSLLLEAESLQEVYAHRKNELSEKLVYIGFLAKEGGNPYEVSHGRCYICFIKTDFRHNPWDVMGEFGIHVIDAGGAAVEVLSIMESVDIKGGLNAHGTAMALATDEAMAHYLEEHHEKIPAAVIGENSHLRLTPYGTALISSGTFTLYNSRYKKIGAAESLSAVYGRAAEWGGEPVYAVFHVYKRAGSNGTRDELCLVRLTLEG